MPIAEEHKLDNPEEVMLRQVHPNFVQEGRPASRAFRPNSDDSGLFSSDRSAIVTPQQAYEAYQHKDRATGGCWGVTIDEYSALNLDSYSDPLVDNGAHALVDFTPHEERLWRSLSKRIHKAAQDRGCLFTADDPA
ncbi:MAG TPA: hypothetical protein PLN33_19555 [Hyphomonadaceae bacterium]|nr:hypothetical protein [Hyphomonadaceae bacterium]